MIKTAVMKNSESIAALTRQANVLTLQANALSSQNIQLMKRLATITDVEEASQMKEDTMAQRRSTQDVNALVAEFSSEIQDVIGKSDRAAIVAELDTNIWKERRSKLKSSGGVADNVLIRKALAGVQTAFDECDDDAAVEELRTNIGKKRRSS